jgi:hypothetical protein
MHVSVSAERSRGPAFGLISYGARNFTEDTDVQAMPVFDDDASPGRLARNVYLPNRLGITAAGSSGPKAGTPWGRGGPGRGARGDPGAAVEENSDLALALLRYRQQIAGARSRHTPGFE